MIKDFDYWTGSAQVYEKPAYSEFKVREVTDITIERKKLEAIEKQQLEKEIARLNRIAAFQEAEQIELDQGRVSGVKKHDRGLYKQRKAEMLSIFGGTIERKKYEFKATKPTLFERFKQFLKKSWKDANF